MESRSRVTKVGYWSQQAYGEVSGPFENPAEQVVTTVVNGNVQGDYKRPNPIYFLKRVSCPPSGAFHTSQTGSNSDVHSDFVSGQFSGSPSDFAENLDPQWDSLQDGNWTKIYDKIRGGNNLIVDLAESAATLRMLRNTTKMHSVMNEFLGRTKIPRRLKRWQERLDYVTGKWLEYRYGWMPLVYSTYDAMETLANKVVVDPDVWVRVRSSRPVSKGIQYGVGSVSDPKVHVRYDLNSRLETKVNFMLPPGLGIHDWTSLNPVGIAWELLPLSFVADWFVNVGQQCSLWENYWQYGANFRGGYETKSYKREQSLTASGIDFYPNPAYWPNGTLMPYQVLSRTVSYKSTTRETMKDRQVLLSIPFPNGIRVEVKLGTKRLLDAASLLQQLVAKKMR